MSNENLMIDAYQELVEDTTVLWDTDSDDDPHAAVVVQLERGGWGGFAIDIGLRQIEGSQLAFVLSVARKYELDAHEENGYLRLSRHYNDTDGDPDEAPVSGGVESA